MPDFSTILKEIWEILLIFLHSIYASLMRVIWPGPGKSLLGEIALVTGAGHGIGRELSLQLGKKKGQPGVPPFFRFMQFFSVGP